MRDPILAVVALTVALAFPFVVDALAPVHDDVVQTFVLTDGASGSLNEALRDARPARLVERNFARGTIDFDGPFPLKIESLRFAFDVERAGRYTIYGISGNELSRPLEMTVNGRPTSNVAFFEATGGAIESHRIAGGVRLSAGTNTLSLVGGELIGRPLAVELRRELPSSFPHFLMLFLAAAAPLGGLLFLAQRWHPGPRMRLIGTCAIGGGILLLAPLIGWWWRGPDLVALGHKHPELQRRVAALERYLDSDRALQDHRERYSVAVFGDSTHYLRLDPDDEMIPMLRRHLPPDQREQIVFYGLSGGGMAAWDYYLLLNRLVALEPDLVVLPVNGSSFSEGWMRNQGYWFPILERYLLPSEYPGALRLSVAGRSFDPGRLLWQRLDDRLFAGRAGPFLRGLRVYEEEERERLSRGLLAIGQHGLPPIPEELARPAREEPSWGAVGIGADHDLFAVYRRINRLAAKHGIEILYYNVYEQSLESGGIGPVTADRDMEAILRTIGSAEGVHVLHFADRYPGSFFMDRWIHLTPEGIAGVAARISAKIVEIKQNRERAAGD